MGHIKSYRFIQGAVALFAMCGVGVTANLITSGSDRPPAARSAKPAPVESVAIAPRSALNGDHPGAPRLAACSPLIDVNLTAQQLVASTCGKVEIATPITSGRPGLRTPTGAFKLFLKEQDVYFYSPWPQGDPNYYPPMFVAYAMEFLDGGYFFHTDADEPASAFGAGSEDGPYASHGCVHVPLSVMVPLYRWAAVGTIVQIHY